MSQASQEKKKKKKKKEKRKKEDILISSSKREYSKDSLMRREIRKRYMTQKKSLWRMTLFDYNIWLMILV